MQSEQGFTLFEVIIVITIVAILALLMNMRQPSSSLYSLSSVTEQLRRDIRYTQTLSMSLNATYTLTTLSSNYTISPDPPSGAYSVTMPSGITLSSTSISFDSTGAPLAAVSVTISSSGGLSNTLSVVAETGFING